MSRSRDLVEIATGKVRVPVGDLTIEERLKLFHVFGSRISRHYYVYNGGGSFSPWIEETRQGGNLKESDGFKITKNFHPAQGEGEKSYQEKTRIAVLAHRVFHTGSYKPYFTRDWQPDARLSFFRLCLTQRGALWFECFETLVDKKLVGNVCKAEYEPVSVSAEDLTKPLPEKLMALLEAAPSFIDQFFHLILELINDEVRMRERRLECSRDLLENLSEIGKPFDITLTSR